MGSFRIVTTVFILGVTVSAHADIIGGTEVRENDTSRRSTVALYSPDGSIRGGALCTASLISKDVAVTAAHCIQAGGPAPVLLFGRNVHSSQTLGRRVTAVRVNPRWHRHQGKGMDQGDIALVKFSGGLPSGYETIRIAESDDSLKPGARAVLAGYGISDARAKTGAGVLRKTRVSISDPRPGKTEMILNQSRGHGACHGDSGGPAFIREKGRMVLAGVTNRSYPAHAPDDCAHQVVYTKVNSYRSWIKHEEKELHARHASPSYVQKLKWKHHRVGRPKKTRHRPHTKSISRPSRSRSS